VFHVRASDVEEMIQARMDEKESPWKECRVSETGLWPEMFRVEEIRGCHRHIINEISIRSPNTFIN